MKLPNGWVKCKLSEFSLIEMGQSPKGEYVSELKIGLPFYQGKTEFGKWYPTPRKYCSTPTKIAEKNDILLSIRAPVGPTNFCPGKSCIGRGLASIRSHELNSQKYLMHYFRYLEPWLSEQGTGSTFRAISGNFVRDIDLLVAPLNEQIRIANKLDSILAKVDQAQARLEKIPTILKRFRQSVLATATSGGLTREWREGKELTTEWESVKLSTIISKIEAGKNIKCDERPPQDNEFGIIKISAVTWGVYNEEQSKTLKNKSLFIEDRRVKVGDFLISRANTLELLGMPVIVHKVTKNLMLSDKVLRLVMPTEDKAWLDIFLRSPSGRLEIQSRATGNQESMRNIGQKALCDIDVLLPTPLEKAEIVQLVGILISHAEMVEKQYYTMKNRLDKLTQSILAKAFRGELVEQDPNDEPARQLLERIKKQRLDSPKPAKKIRTTTKNVHSTGELEPTVAESDLSQSEILMLLQKSNSELTAQQLIDKLTEQTFEQIDSLFTELKRLLDMQAIAKVGTGESCTFKAIKK
ncbi:MAG: restriction endonuclease subunit S [Tolumonas sp.]|nr:restriction endonuclease subunit S [Tolumonas sp.]